MASVIVIVIEPDAPSGGRAEDRDLIIPISPEYQWAATAARVWPLYPHIRWIARDRDSEISAFVEKPRLDLVAGQWVDATVFDDLTMTILGDIEIPWDRSLIQRPEGA